MQHALEIRTALPADEQAVFLLLRAFRDHLGESVPWEADLKALLPAALSDPGREFACAWFGDEPLGYTQTRFFASIWAAGLEAFLEDLFVLSSARGQAVGRALLRHALQRARARGARVLGLSTNELNEPAQCLYASEGLRPEATKLWAGGREVCWAIKLGASRAPSTP